MDSKHTRRENFKDILLSQLYLSEDRLQGIDERGDVEPLPVKKVADKLFFTDGHHRAFALWERGEEEVEVYEDTDDMDWLQYLICVDWCLEEGLESIADLEDRIVSEEEFKRSWLDRCEEMHRENAFKHVRVKEEREPNTKSEICESVIRSLPEWFGIEKAIVDFIEGVKDKLFLAVYVKSIPVGFISIKEHNEFTSEIYVLGIVKELHGRGIGKRLFGAVEKRLRQQGKKFVSVKTLSGSHPDENYKRTREFYRAVGFYPLEEFPTLWDEDNPCLIMVKNLENILSEELY